MYVVAIAARRQVRLKADTTYKLVFSAISAISAMYVFAISVERRDATPERLHVFDDARVVLALFVVGGLGG